MITEHQLETQNLLDTLINSSYTVVLPAISRYFDWQAEFASNHHAPRVAEHWQKLKNSLDALQTDMGVIE